MQDLVKTFSTKSCKASVPELKVGYIVAVHQKIREGNKERIQVFQGTIIAVNPGFGVNSTFTVRKISEKIGVEKVFAVHSPLIVKIDVLRAQRVRRAKLNFLRDRSGKALRLPEVELKLREKKFETAIEKSDEKNVEDETSAEPVINEEVVKTEKPQEAQEVKKDEEVKTEEVVEVKKESAEEEK